MGYIFSHHHIPDNLIYVGEHFRFLVRGNRSRKALQNCYSGGLGILRFPAGYIFPNSYSSDFPERPCRIARGTFWLFGSDFPERPCRIVTRAVLEYLDFQQGIFSLSAIVRIFPKGPAELLLGRAWNT